MHWCCYYATALDIELRELYAALVVPLEEHLTGAEEMLIVPHKELFEVPWAALIDDTTYGNKLTSRTILVLNQAKTEPKATWARSGLDAVAAGPISSHDGDRGWGGGTAPPCGLPVHPGGWRDWYAPPTRPSGAAPQSVPCCITP